MMIVKRSMIGILISLCFSAVTPSLVQAEKASIEDLLIERGKGSLKVSFSVKHCFNKKMEEAIKAGIPTTFNFFVKFYKKRALIWNKKIASHQFQHRIVYDNLKEDFSIWLEEQGKEIRVAELEEAKRYMQRVDGFSVFRERELEKGSYELAIKAELDPVKLPLGLESILFFVSLWDFETNWYHHTVRVER
jgi:hypothetical protein